MQICFLLRNWRSISNRKRVARVISWLFWCKSRQYSNHDNTFLTASYSTPNAQKKLAGHLYWTKTCPAYPYRVLGTLCGLCLCLGGEKVIVSVAQLSLVICSPTCFVNGNLNVVRTRKPRQLFDLRYIESSTKVWPTKWLGNNCNIYWKINLKWVIGSRSYN